jgi:hypothetical protein
VLSLASAPRAMAVKRPQKKRRKLHDYRGNRGEC